MQSTVKKYREKQTLRLESLSVDEKDQLVLERREKDRIRKQKSRAKLILNVLVFHRM
jgi:hypothetical protein